MAKDNLLPFHFKHFVIHHDRCAMKVGTDGLLIGAWVSINGYKSIVDIGAGSGLISLMLAQRSANATILGVEIDEPAFRQAAENIANSIFRERIQLVHDSILNVDIAQGSHLIVSNPPFFSTGVKSSNVQRSNARHDDQLSLSNLVQKAANSLNENGMFALIWPYDRSEELFKETEEVGLHLRRQTIVFTARHKHPSRVLVEFCKTAHTPDVDELIVQENGEYTDSYRRLLKDFYLDF
jgi:tRNA1Val (adenine37-N6)-methyltransferase